jgi:predicted neutral ceramidase superfamily lipid hydrolase
MAQSSFSLASFLLRWLVALVLVFATFNPTDYSYYRWVAGMDAGMDGGNLALKVLAGVALLILYVIYLRATWRSIGPIGVSLATAFLGAVIWVTIDLGLLDLERPTIITWVLLFALATILAIGISWSHVRRRVSGQADMDDVDE